MMGIDQSFSHLSGQGTMFDFDLNVFYYKRWITSRGCVGKFFGHSEVGFWCVHMGWCDGVVQLVIDSHQLRLKFCEEFVAFFCQNAKDTAEGFVELTLLADFVEVHDSLDRLS